jgi:hypothetical protein
MLESAMNALAPVAEKLGKLIRLLSSDRDGEVAAAVEAIKCTLKNVNLSFHGLATGIEGGGGGNGKLKFTEAEAEEINQRSIEAGRKHERERNGFGGFHNVNDADDPSWHEIARECAAHPEVFKCSKEREFVDDMVKRTAHGGHRETRPTVA